MAYISLHSIPYITECEDGYFGVDYCNVTCNCMDPEDVCDKVNGSCNSGCMTGFTGEDCQKGKYYTCMAMDMHT